MVRQAKGFSQSCFAAEDGNFQVNGSQEHKGGNYVLSTTKVMITYSWRTTPKVSVQKQGQHLLIIRRVHQHSRCRGEGRVLTGKWKLGGENKKANWEEETMVKWQGETRMMFKGLNPSLECLVFLQVWLNASFWHDIFQMSPDCVRNRKRTKSGLYGQNGFHWKTL